MYSGGARAGGMKGEIVNLLPSEPLPDWAWIKAQQARRKPKGT